MKHTHTTILSSTKGCETSGFYLRQNDESIVFVCGVIKNEVDLYSAFIVVPHTQGAQVTDHTVSPANYAVPASTS